MIEIRNVSKTFITSEGETHALRNVSFTVNDGQCVLVGGENGSGKSVLMSIIAGLETADSGSVNCHGKRPGLVFQEAETQILGETAREDIAFGPRNLGWKKDRIESAVNAALERTGLAGKADFPARFLSGGEKRRLAVACMTAMDLPVIILDEPYANLDYSGVKQVNALVRNLRKEGRTVMILSHEVEKCLGLCDSVIVLFRGEKVFEGTPLEALGQDLEKWNIRNPIVSYRSLEDLAW